LREDSDTKYSAKSIRKAFYTLAPALGISSVDGIVADFDVHGLSLYDENAEYSLSQIERGLANIFGDATALLFELIKKELLKERA
jgi:hypothetical protein